VTLLTQQFESAKLAEAQDAPSCSRSTADTARAALGPKLRSTSRSPESSACSSASAGLCSRVRPQPWWDRGDSEDATRPDRLMSGTPPRRIDAKAHPTVESACGSSEPSHVWPPPSSSEPARSGAALATPGGLVTALPKFESLPLVGHRPPGLRRMGPWCAAPGGPGSALAVEERALPVDLVAGLEGDLRR